MILNSVSGIVGEDHMLPELYIEALLVDEELADSVWEAWDAGLIPDEEAEKITSVQLAIDYVSAHME